eukprot:NODE_1382_length_2498_cov_7.150148.p1 GENE.NODE_1382_length_2498_cov_7.150148~~NODE_1382_length_2498_cov_7.150148.p1  ORF type:complete len:770 (+),score=159.38 NODE_1382_length_2498_cov_7.150148:291-2312(+)
MVARVQDIARQTVSLMVSTSGSQSFSAALLPTGLGELEEKWYTILDTSEGAVILHIDSSTADAVSTGRIFISDATGVQYSEALLNNVRSSTGDCEFDRLQGLPGVYMANVVVPLSKDSSGGLMDTKRANDEAMEQEAASGTEMDKKHGRGGKGISKPAKDERTIRTVITFNKGGAWSYLKPPKVDSAGKRYPCDSGPLEQCSLHLHGTSSWDYYAPFYSLESAIGIIMGTGNVGPSLRFEPDEAATFLSRDGGLTWFEVHTSAFIYEYGDHGGLVLMADDLQKTNEVVFSWNEGTSWYDFSVTSTPFEVDNILTEPNVTSTNFVMFGTREEGAGVLYHLKFDPLRFPPCAGVWAADAATSDYETWTPSDGVNTDKCLLGQTITYTRRKRTSQCWNGEAFERPTFQKQCACTQEDFECELGFLREIGSTVCTFGGHELLPPRFLPQLCEGVALVNAYRKVPGDKCSGGWAPQQVEVPCPSSHVKAAVKRFYPIILLVLVLAYMYRQRFSGSAQKVTKHGADIFEAVAPSGGHFMWAVQPLQVMANLCRAISAKLSAQHHGFETFKGTGYKRVNQGTGDFDMESEDTLTEFIDEAEHDDIAPRYETDHGSFAQRYEVEGKRPERMPTISGGLASAGEEVPRLYAPPSAAGSGIRAPPPEPPAQHFCISEEDVDLL